MKILVIDVAAEHGGAKTVLEQHISKFKKNPQNIYLVILSVLDYENSDNIKFMKVNWVKKSYLHRLFFDLFYIKKIVKKFNPDRILSLQNKCVSAFHIPQYVYFHNALPIAEKRFSFKESKLLWVYQNVIGNIYKYSLRNATGIYVQSEWIKKELINKWKLDGRKIQVNKPIVNIKCETKKIKTVSSFFYPANGEIYKNHERLIKAFICVWQKYPISNNYPLVLTGELKDLPKSVQILLQKRNYPIRFVGRLSFNEMVNQYKRSILVFPSYIETVGLPLLEARELGCMILVADCDYAHEALGNYNQAKYFNPYKADAIQKSIVDSLRVLNIKNKADNNQLYM